MDAAVPDPFLIRGVDCLGGLDPASAARVRAFYENCGPLSTSEWQVLDEAGRDLLPDRGRWLPYSIDELYIDFLVLPRLLEPTLAWAEAIVEALQALARKERARLDNEGARLEEWRGLDRIERAAQLECRVAETHARSTGFLWGRWTRGHREARERAASLKVIYDQARNRASEFKGSGRSDWVRPEQLAERVGTAANVVSWRWASQSCVGRLESDPEGFMDLSPIAVARVIGQATVGLMIGDLINDETYRRLLEPWQRSTRRTPWQTDPGVRPDAIDDEAPRAPVALPAKPVSVTPRSDMEIGREAPARKRRGRTRDRPEAPPVAMPTQIAAAALLSPALGEALDDGRSIRGETNIRRSLQPGDRVWNHRWGEGMVVASELADADERVSVLFRDPRVGGKLLLRSLASLEEFHPDEACRLEEARAAKAAEAALAVLVRWLGPDDLFTEWSTLRTRRHEWSGYDGYYVYAASVTHPDGSVRTAEGPSVAELRLNLAARLARTWLANQLRAHNFTVAHRGACDFTEDHDWQDGDPCEDGTSTTVAIRRDDPQGWSQDRDPAWELTIDLADDGAPVDADLIGSVPQMRWPSVDPICRLFRAPPHEHGEACGSSRQLTVSLSGPGDWRKVADAMDDSTVPIVKFRYFTRDEHEYENEGWGDSDAESRWYLDDIEAEDQERAHVSSQGVPDEWIEDLIASGDGGPYDWLRREFGQTD